MQSSNGGGEAAPFFEAAVNFYEMGMSVLPANGKIPAIRRWKPYQKKIVSERTLENWCERKPQCNLAIVTGALSGITVLDSDDPNISTGDLMKQYGYTPLVVKTPSGGHHLYYRHNGERNATRVGGRRIDIRGEGGYVIAPPSRSAETGQQYRFVVGSEWDLKSLPEMAHTTDIVAAHGIEGTRNIGLFKHLINVALQVESDEQLLEMAFMYNEAVNTPPLPEVEVTRAVNSVWKYKIKKSIFTGGNQYLIYHGETHCSLWSTYPDAACLRIYLQAHHAQGCAPFAVSPKAIGGAFNIGWRKIKKAVDVLTQQKILRQTYVGGRGPGDPHLFEWVQNMYQI